MKGEYYLMCVGREGKRLDNPYTIGLGPKELSSKQSSISWMKIGQGIRDDYRFCKRLDKTRFKCVDTNEIFEIKERGAFTVEAWERFLNEVD